MPTLRSRRPHSSLWSLWFFRFVRKLARVALSVVYRIRVEGVERVPSAGAVLIAANHQSFLDPPAIGGVVRHRQCDFIARGGLFKFRPFAWLITNLNSIPLRENEPDAAAIKEILRRLDQGSVVLIFPEGMRSPDGAMRTFSRGVALLVKRSNCPVLPAAIEGAFDAWPRQRKFPRLFGQRLAVKFGTPIPHEELLRDGPDAALRRLEREIDAMRLELRAELRSATRGRYPGPGPGDEPFGDGTDANAEA